MTTTPSPTPLLRTSLLTNAWFEDDSSLTALSHKGAQSAAETYGLAYALIVASDMETAILSRVAAGDDVIITLGEDLSSFTRQTAVSYPEIVFIAVGQTETESVPRPVILGGARTRHDQIAFVAGVMAGLQTETRVAGSVVPAGDLRGRKYANGFLHGVRLACGPCEVWSVVVEEYGVKDKGTDAVQRLLEVGTDTLFAAPGAAGKAAIKAAVNVGVAVIGAGHDYYANPFARGEIAGSEHLLGSVIYRPDVILDIVMSDILNDVLPSGPIPFSFESGTLDVVIPNGSPLSPAARDITMDVISRLTSGELGTGVDPLTGEEQ